MPRKSAKSTTVRDERSSVRQVERERRTLLERREERTAELVAEFDSRSRPVLPDAKHDVRLLRSGLAARGENLVCHGNAADSTTLAPSHIEGGDYQARRLCKERSDEWDLDD